MNEATQQANGQPLPQQRQVAVEQGLRFYNETAAERDALAAEVTRLKSDIAGYRVAIDALQAQVADMQSRVETATLVRDQAVADRTKWEALFASLQAQLRAFEVPAAPLVKARDETAEAPPIGGA